MNTLPPPGWYQDPSGMPDTLRWWDGTAWTGYTQPLAAAQAPYQEVQQGSAGTDPYGQAHPSDQARDTDPYGQSPAAPPHTPGTDPYGQTAPYTAHPAGSDQGHPAGYPPAQPQYAQGPGYSAGFGPGWPGAGEEWNEWQVADADDGERKTWPWLVAGGAGLLVIVIVGIVALYATGVLGGSGGGSAPVAQPSGDTQQQQPASPVVGKITDQEAGLRYAKFGGKWAQLQRGSEIGMESWTAGQYQVAQPDYQGDSDYYATIVSAPLPETMKYDGPDQLEAATTYIADWVEQHYYPPEHTRNDTQSESVTVDGNRAWKVSYTLEFPEAEQNGWDFRSETVILMVIDRGSDARPAVFFATLPDNLPLQPDLQAVVESLEVRQ